MKTWARRFAPLPTLRSLPDRLAAEPPAGPVVVLIGRVFAHYVAAANAERAPLAPVKAAIR